MKRYRFDILAIILITLLGGIFFFRLFYPEPQLIVTPDYGRSDAWHFSFATKYALSQSLTSNALPLWRKDIGNGFPLFAEGQVGALYLPNLLLFGLFPPVLAYNIALVFSVAFLGVGMYWFTRKLALSPLASVFCAVTVMFSGLTMTQLTHITLLNAMSLLPWIAGLSLLVVSRGPFPWMGIVGFALSQQLFAGFPQATFLTLLFSFALVLFFATGQNKRNRMIFWALGVLLGILAAAVQLFPSWEFLQEGTDPKGFTPAIATMYSMPLKHFLSFINPFAFGNPRLGTYPPFYAFDGSIFWENTPSMGIVPLILLVFSLARRKKQPIEVFLWGITLISLLLAGGKYAPTYVVFSIFPLTLFRVPSRFLWISVISLSLLSAHVFDRFRLRPTVYLLVFVHVLGLLWVFWSYHLVEPARLWTKTPALTQAVQGGRVFTIGEGKIHNDRVVTTGWQEPSDFRFLREGLSPDSNMLWGISQTSVYAGRYLNRPSITNSLLTESIRSDEKGATLSASAIKFLNLFSVRHILSFLPLDAPLLVPEQTLRDGKLTLTLYKNPQSLERAYFVFEATTAATLSQAITILNSPNFVPGTSVLLEQHEPLPSLDLSPAPTRITWIKDTHEHIELAVETQNRAILVLSDTNYPGWVARIDGKTVGILTANLSQRAIAVPEGTHTVTFTYKPTSVRFGGWVSVGGFFLIALLTIAPWIVQALHIHKKARVPEVHHQRTPRR